MGLLKNNKIKKLETDILLLKKMVEALTERINNIETTQKEYNKIFSDIKTEREEELSFSEKCKGLIARGDEVEL